MSPCGFFVPYSFSLWLYMLFDNSNCQFRSWSKPVREWNGMRALHVYMCVCVRVRAVALAQAVAGDPRTRATHPPLLGSEPDCNHHPQWSIHHLNRLSNSAFIASAYALALSITFWMSTYANLGRLYQHLYDDTKFLIKNVCNVPSVHCIQILFENTLREILYYNEEIFWKCVQLQSLVDINLL